MTAERDRDGAHEDQAALRLAAAGPSALCTIVGIEGSFSRRLGAQIAFGETGAQAGDLSDGCLEDELRSQAAMAREPVVLRYGRGSPFIDFRLPCGSGLDILIDPAPDRDTLAAAVSRLDQRGPATLTLPVVQVGQLTERRYIPRLRIVALGAHAEVIELARLAHAFGVEIVQIRPDQGLSPTSAPAVALDPWTAIVLLFHDHEWERSFLSWALESRAFYIGAIGGQTVRDQRRDFLKETGWPEEQINRVRSRIGLIPHTRDARVMALSVLSEIVASYERLRTARAK